MLNLREADVTQTRFYQQVLEIGEKKGRLEGESELLLRLLTRRCGNLPLKHTNRVRSLSIPQLESLGEPLLDCKNIADFDQWLDREVVWGDRQN